MAFDTTPPRNDYIGTGTVAAYDFTFEIIAATDLRVTKRDTAGVETALAVTTGFTVPAGDIGNPNGGTITLAAGNLPLNYALTIRNDRTPQQTTDLRNQGGFFLEVHEDKFDELTRYVQALRDLVLRSLHLPETEVGSEALTKLPSVLERASKFAAWNALGEIIASGGGLTSPPVSAFMATALDDTTAAAARATLGEVEGNWTPSLGGTTTYFTQFGRYTKVGNKVTIWCDLAVDLIGTGSVNTISGLPFTVVSDAYGTGAVEFFSAAVNTISMVAITNGAATTIRIKSSPSAATSIGTSNVFGNNTGVKFSLSYRTL